MCFNKTAALPANKVSLWLQRDEQTSRFLAGIQLRLGTVSGSASCTLNEAERASVISLHEQLFIRYFLFTHREKKAYERRGTEKEENRENEHKLGGNNNIAIFLNYSQPSFFLSVHWINGLKCLHMDFSLDSAKIINKKKQPLGDNGPIMGRENNTNRRTTGDLAHFKIPVLLDCLRDYAPLSYL